MPHLIAFIPTSILYPCKASARNWYLSASPRLASPAASSSPRRNSSVDTRRETIARALSLIPIQARNSPGRLPRRNISPCSCVRLSRLTLRPYFHCLNVKHCTFSTPFRPKPLLSLSPSTSFSTSSSFPYAPMPVFCPAFCASLSQAVHSFLSHPPSPPRMHYLFPSCHPPSWPSRFYRQS